MRHVLFLAALLFAAAGFRRLLTSPAGAVARPAAVPPVPVVPVSAEAVAPAASEPARARGRTVAGRSRAARRTGVFLSTSVVAMLLIAVLGGIGMANGLWGKNLILNASVETGDLKADWDKLSTLDACGGRDQEEAPQVEVNGALEQPLTMSGGDSHGGDPGPCPPESCHFSFDADCKPACPETESLTLSGGQHDPPPPDDDCRPKPACEVAGGVGTQEAEVEITFARKGYWCIITGLVSNTGSVPFNVIGAHMIIDNDNEEGLQEGFPPHWFPGCKLPYEVQVDPGGEAEVQCKVSVKETAEDGMTYHFAIEVCVAQWNEDPSAGGANDDFKACKQSPQHEGPDTPVLPTPSATEGGP